MNPMATLLWLEFKRSAWVIYGALIGLVLFALVLVSLPGVVTGLDALNLPSAGVASTVDPACEPPNCKQSGHSSVQLSQSNSESNSSFQWSFSRTWGDPSQPEPGVENKNPDLDDTTAMPGAAPGTDPSVVQVPIPEELQLAFRPRQAITAATAFVLTGLMLLGFWISQSREADRGELVILYQSPVSGETQLSLRFLYMAGTATAVLVLVLAIYWIVQISQSQAPQAPIVEAFGARVYVHWDNLILTALATSILPNTAFALLFIQMQNAYDLLGGKRLIGFVLVLTALVLSMRSFFKAALDPQPAGAVLQLVSVVSNPTLDTVVSDFAPGQFRIDVPLEWIAIGAGVTFLMLILSARVWREVEWS